VSEFRSTGILIQQKERKGDEERRSGDVGCGESANRIERVPNRCGSRWSPHLTNYTPNPYQFSKESTKDTKKCRGDRPVALVEPWVESGEALLTP